jgi:peroxiredoxin
MRHHPLPDFTLRAAGDNREVSLSKLLGQGPVVLSFHRGQWCPYCNVELRPVEQRYPEIRGLGAEVLFVEPETRENAAKLIEKSEATLPVLYDIDGDVMDAFGLTVEVPQSLRPIYDRFGFPDLNSATGWKLPVPATYAIRKDRGIVASFANADYRYRMDPDDIITVLRKIVAPVS